NSPHAIMHGFVNVFVAAAFAWQGKDGAAVIGVLHECDPESFVFLDDALTWRARRLTTEQIVIARRDFAHSFGSCSFEEPVAGLRALRWLRGSTLPTIRLCKVGLSPPICLIPIFRFRACRTRLSCAKDTSKPGWAW